MTYLGLDKGGTRHTLALADSGGAVVRRVQHAADRVGGAAAELASLRRDIEAFVREAAALGDPVAGVGISFGGPVDVAQGTVITSHHVAGWNGMPLRALCAEWAGVPVAIDNDANAGALGEWTFGAGVGCRDLVYVNIGTGIGGAVIANNALVRGPQNLAGEIGHLVLDPAGPRCTCEKHGCLEAYASGPSIERRYRERFGAKLSGREIFARAIAGDAGALAHITDTAEYLARGLGAAISLLNPARIILGGGVAESGPLLYTLLRHALPRYVLPQALAAEVLPAQLGYDAGVRGAIALAMNAVTG